jgi:hypothetical protein
MNTTAANITIVSGGAVAVTAGGRGEPPFVFLVLGLTNSKADATLLNLFYDKK